MIITIQYFPDANSLEECDIPLSSYCSKTPQEAHDALALLNHAIEIENRSKDSVNAGADTLQPDIEEDL